MSWLSLIIVYVLCESSGIYIDNYISDYYFKGKLAVAQKYFYILPYFLTALVLLAIGNSFFPLSETPLSTILLVFGSGVSISIATIFYFRALELDNSTNFGIFFQLAPVLYLILGWIFFGETIMLPQLGAFLIISFAPLLIILTTKKRSKKRIQIKAAACIFIYILITVISNLIFADQAGNRINFFSQLAFVILGKVAGNVVLLGLYPKWRKRYHYVVKRSRKKVLRPLFLNYVLVIMKNLAIYGALTLAHPAALPLAVGDSAKPIVIFLMGIILSYISPKVGREELKLRPIMVHLVATVLLVVGIIILRQQYL